VFKKYPLFALTEFLFLSMNPSVSATPSKLDQCPDREGIILALSFLDQTYEKSQKMS